MSFEWIRICLLGWPTRRRALGNEFFDLLGLEPDAGFKTSPATMESQAAEITLVLASRDVEAPQSDSEFAATIATGLRRAAEWLQLRPCSVFERCRAAGIRLEILVAHVTDEGGFRLELPAEFVRECGRVGLPIRVGSGD
jgi:hypothetical protein